LREGLPDVVVGPHAQPEQLVDLVVLGCQEYHRQVALLAQALQQFQPIHARHLDIEDGKIRRTGLKPIERRDPVRVSHNAIAFGLESNRDRGQDIAVVVDESDGRHGAPLYASLG